jgi:hypothetical protein
MQMQKMHLLTIDYITTIKQRQGLLLKHYQQQVEKKEGRADAGTSSQTNPNRENTKIGECIVNNYTNL